MTVDEKAQLRTRFKTIRAELKSSEKDKAILDRLVKSPFFVRNRFFVYHSIGSEADTRRIIDLLLSADKRVLVPRIERNRMYSVPYSAKTELYMGIPQPVSGEEEGADVILAPLVAFDEEGYRLGYGGGYYDQYFARCNGIRVGLAYEGQAVKTLPRDQYDVPLDAVVTEAGVRYFT